MKAAQLCRIISAGCAAALCSVLLIKNHSGYLPVSARDYRLV